MNVSFLDLFQTISSSGGGLSTTCMCLRVDHRSTSRFCSDLPLALQLELMTICWMNTDRAILTYRSSHFPYMLSIPPAASKFGCSYALALPLRKRKI